MASCDVIIKDEVNVKINRLELTTRRKLVNKFKYEIPGARFMPAVRLGRWDGCVSFFSMGGQTYVNMLDEILPIIESEGYHINLTDDRPPLELQFDEIEANYLAETKWPIGHPAQGQPIVLRDYQVEVINKFLHAPQSIQEIATGAGKTIITATLSKLCEPYGRTVIIVPNKSLVTQTEEDYKNIGVDVGVYYGDRKQLNRTHTICTWQSLNNLMKASKDGLATTTMTEFAENVACIIVDEVHMAKADVLKQLLTGPFAHCTIRWGLTGTVPKEDYNQKALSISIGQVAHRISASELQDAGILANCHVNIIQTEDFVAYKTYQEEQKYLTTTKTRMGFVANEIKDIAQSGNTLILVNYVKTGELLAQMITNSVFVSGKTKVQDRKEEYDEIKTASNKIIIATYGVAAVGINIPRINK